MCVLIAEVEAGQDLCKGVQRRVAMGLMWEDDLQPMCVLTAERGQPQLGVEVPGSHLELQEGIAGDKLPTPDKEFL